MLVTGTGQPTLFTHTARFPNASGTGGYRGGDAERRDLRAQAEARQPPTGHPHQNSAADVRRREPQVSVHVLDAGLLGDGEGAVEDCHLVLQPVRNRRFCRKGEERDIYFFSPGALFLYRCSDNEGRVS